jgi:hypothetical protein
MTVLVPIRSDNGYIGMSKQLLQGTPVAPANFPRILDGSSWVLELAAGELWEMDGSRHVSQLIKNKQSVKIKQVVTPRMNEVGLLEQATMGIGSDTITAGSPAGTLHTALSANSSTTIVVTGAGFSPFVTPASGNLYLIVVDPTNGNEIIPCTLPATVATQYTFTIASTYNSGKPKLSHAGADALVVDVLTTVSTSITSNAVAGASAIILGNNNNMTATATSTVVLSPGTAREEIVTLSTPASSGTGPWTFTLANGAVLKNAHTIGDLAYSAVVHVVTDESDGDYYTLEVGLGSLAGAAGMTIRVRDCKVSTCKVSGKAGSELQYELEWEGIACAVQNAPATLTFEAHPVFLYTQGVWTLDGSSSSNDAISIESFSIERKNNPDAVQTESLVNAAIIFGNMAVDVAFETVYTSGSRFFLVYFGGPTGTADSQVIGAGSFLVTFTQPDNLEALTYSVPVQHYSKVGGVEPKKDGKHYKQAVSAIGVSNAGANLFVMQTTINNTQLSQY